MLKYITIFMFIGISLIHAENIQTLNKLETENQVLALQLEAIALKKQIIEMENFIESDKLKKKTHLKHAKAIIQFRNELRVSRNRSRRTHLNYGRHR